MAKRKWQDGNHIFTCSVEIKSETAVKMIGRLAALKGSAVGAGDTTFGFDPMTSNTRAGPLISIQISIFFVVKISS